MATQPQTEQPSHSASEHKERDEALNGNIKTELALGELDGFLIAALCVIRMEEDGDMAEDDKQDTLETLIKYARAALFDANEGHKAVWEITSGHVYGNQCTAPKAKTVQPDQPA